MKPKMTPEEHLAEIIRNAAEAERAACAKVVRTLEIDQVAHLSQAIIRETIAVAILTRKRD